MFVPVNQSVPQQGVEAGSLPPAARRREWLQARHPQWHSLTLSQALDAAVVEFGPMPLVVTDAKSFTYSEVQSWSRAIAVGLIERGLRAGDHIALVMANFPEFVAVKYAIARIGAVAVPINFALRRQELTYILGQSDARALIIMDRLRDRDYLQDLDAIVPGWPLRAGGALLPQLEHVFVHSTGGRLPANVVSVESLAASGSAVSRAELTVRERGGDAHFRSDVIYTSGTTGQPKGVMLSHDMILRAAYASAYTRAFEKGRRILFSLPMYHVFGYVECLIAATFAGGAIVPRVSFEAPRFLEAAGTHAATEIVCVPMMTLKLLEAADSIGFDGRHLISMFNSGGASPPTIWRDIRDKLGAREVLTAYGMTETTASTTCTRPEDSDEYLLTTNGRFKFAGVAGDPALEGLLAIYKTIDPVSGADLSPGVPGELVALGPIVTTGYYKKPEETAAAFTPDGWLHTGDVGVVTSDGFLTLTGRLKETYRCGGEMVMPREIEDLLNTHPLVAQAHVVGIPDQKMGEVGCVCVIPAGDRRPEPKELIDLCSAGLAKFKVPRHVVFITAEELPLTATGRPQKFLLMEIARTRLAALQREKSAW